MPNKQIIQQINDQISQLFSGFSNNSGDSDSTTSNDNPNELKKSVHTIVQNVFSKLDLVTRDEFDAQQAVLQKTRRRVESLERELQELTKQTLTK